MVLFLGELFVVTQIIAIFAFVQVKCKSTSFLANTAIMTKQNKRNDQIKR